LRLKRTSCGVRFVKGTFSIQMNGVEAGGELEETLRKPCRPSWAVGNSIGEEAKSAGGKV